MKKTILSFSLAISAALAFAQQDPQFTQYMFMKLPTNPGYAGTRGNLCATTAYRTQWVGFDGAPKTIFVTADMPVSDLKGGIGFTLMKDKLGNFNFTHARGAYSYHRSMNKGIGLLGLGLEFGMFQASVDNNWLEPDGSHGELDPGVPNDFVNRMTYDIGAGIYYRTDQYYFGASMSHAAGKAEQLLAKDFKYEAAGHFYLMTGYYFRPIPKINIRPSLLVKSDGAVAAFDIHCDLLYNDFIWSGLSFRPGDAIAPNIGIAFKPNRTQSSSYIKIGYSYDIGISDLKGHHSNTHEIVVNYCIKWNKPIPTHENPRLMGNKINPGQTQFDAPHWIE